MRQFIVSHSKGIVKKIDDKTPSLSSVNLVNQPNIFQIVFPNIDLCDLFEKLRLTFVQIVILFGAYIMFFFFFFFY